MFTVVSQVRVIPLPMRVVLWVMGVVEFAWSWAERLNIIPLRTELELERERERRRLILMLVDGSCHLSLNIAIRR